MPLPRVFFARDADVVARELLGRRLVHQLGTGVASGRIVETEAYFGPAGENRHLAGREDLPARFRAVLLRSGDSASHAFRGLTPRSRPMWGAPGHAYVYSLYGHACLNVTTGRDGDPQAVLLRAVEIAGAPPRVASGPGRLTRALGVTLSHNTADMTGPPLTFEEGAPPQRVARGPRVGVTTAVGYPLRFLDAGSAAVSRGPRAAVMRAR